MSHPKKPTYSLHKPTGQAITRIRVNGQRKMLYLGMWNTPQSKAKYEEILTDWLLKHDRLAHGQLQIDELVLMYLDHAQEYYRKEGELTSEYACIKSALRFVLQHCGRLRVLEFGPKLLKEVREQMIGAEFKRSTINKHVGRIRRMFRWGVENEYVAVDVLTALQSIAGLRKGRSQACESEPVKSIPQEYIDAVLLKVSTPIANMIRFQQLTGMRPEEVVELREGEIDRNEEVWQYVPRSHKTEHHDKERIIFIGPQAQKIINPLFHGELGRYIFRPSDAVSYHHHYGERYSVDSYRRAIQRACTRAQVPSWSPNQLRHSAGTEIRKKFGLEASQVVLGHTNAKVTEIYAERNMDLAREIMAKVG